MNTLVIIGNGFDLAHGMKTGYNDFLLWYWNNALSIFISENYFEDDLIIISPNIGYSYLQNTEYKNLENLINKLILKSSETNSSTPLKVTFKSHFFSYLTQRCIDKNWGGFEVSYNDYLSILLRDHNFESKNNTLNIEFEFLKEKLEQYLSTIKANYSSKIENTLREISKLKNPSNLFSEKKNQIANFNYTKTHELYIGIINRIKFMEKPINIHGELNNPDNPIILGYGNENNSNYLALEKMRGYEQLRHIKSFQYFKTSNYKRLSLFIESDDFEVVILGHSCGDSDGTLLKEIFEHKNCKSIKIYYKDEADYSQKTMEISRHFSNKIALRNKIISFEECQPLN